MWLFLVPFCLVMLPPALLLAVADLIEHRFAVHRWAKPIAGALRLAVIVAFWILVIWGSFALERP